MSEIRKDYNPKDNIAIACRYLKEEKGITMTQEELINSSSRGELWHVFALINKAVNFYYPSLKKYKMAIKGKK